MTRARDESDFFNNYQVSGKNIVINGDFGIWSRGTSFSNPAVGTYLADRWVSGPYQGGTTTVSQQAIGAPINSQYYMRIAYGAANSYNNVTSIIETKNTLPFVGQIATLTMKLRRNALLNTDLGAILYGSTTTDAGISATWNPIAFITIPNGNLPVATTSSDWYTVKMSGLIGSDIKSLRVHCGENVAQSSGAYWEIAQVQLEAGSTSTTFSRFGGNSQLEAAATGSSGFDGVLVSTNSLNNPSGSGTNGWAGYQVAGKNKIINGDFNIWQRGTSFTPGNGATIYTADRFSCYWDGNGSHTISRQTFTPGAAPVAGYEGTYYYRHQQTTAGTGGTYMAVIGQIIEDVRTFAGQTMTISFWIKTDTARTYPLFVDQGFGTGGSSSVNVAAISVPTTTSWQRVSYTINVPSIVGKTIGTGSNLNIRMDSNYVNQTQTIDIWGFQVELGSVASAFTTASGTLQGELALCQRYYWRWNTTSTYGMAPYLGYSISTTSSQIGIVPPTTMRVFPSSIDYSSSWRITEYKATYTAVTGFLILGATESGSGGGFFIAANTAGSLTAGRPASITASNDASAYIGFSAEF
jgi:hypothetical protein